jgi:predicted DNA-binding mobile mystery protein A
MSLKRTSTHLRRRQLDVHLSTLVPFATTSRPRKGWIREIRSALGMTSGQLARRAGVSQPTVINLEQSEEADTISLQSLKKMAGALDCSLVYAFVPRDTLEETLRQQAEKRTEELCGRVEHTMQLEAQGRPSEERERERQELAEEMIRTLSRDLWE